MSVVINGTTGITLPGNTSTALNAVPLQQLSGRTAQVQVYRTGAVASGSTTIPYDNTIPQITEGDQYMSITVTPTNASSMLEITVTAILSCTNPTQNVVAALFRTGVSDALAAAAHTQNVGTGVVNLSFKHHMTAGTTSPITFTVRAGGQAGTCYLNGNNTSGALLGGKYASSITVVEYLP